MNPFFCPDKICVYTRPQDMRAGINRLAEKVIAEIGGKPTDGGLYVFVSRNCKKVKMVRFESPTWCMYTVSLAEGKLRWKHSKDGKLTLEVERRQLLWLLEGLPIEQPDAVKPVTATGIL